MKFDAKHVPSHRYRIRAHPAQYHGYLRKNPHEVAEIYATASILQAIAGDGHPA
jgi:hypothetical protein